MSHYGGGRDYNNRDDRGGGDRRYNDRERSRERGGHNDYNRGGGGHYGGRDDRGGYGRGGNDHSFRGGGRDSGGYGGRGGGGRGGGGRDGGGRGGGGPNPHMGAALNPRDLSLTFSDADICAVVCPPASQRLRDFITNTHDKGTIPPISDLRMAPYLGKRVSKDCNGKIISNHFRVDLSPLPELIYQYQVRIYRLRHEGGVLVPEEEDRASEGDSRTSVRLINTLFEAKISWRETAERELIGHTYDTRSLLFTTSLLDFGSTSAEIDGVEEVSVNLEFYEDIQLDKANYRVHLQFVNEIHYPLRDDDAEMIERGTSWHSLDAMSLRALDSALFAFARKEHDETNPKWFMDKSKAFKARQDKISLGNSSYVAMKGYYAAFKSCMAGLVLVVDMSVSCFLQGGNMVDVMAAAGEFRGKDEMIDATKRNNGHLPSQVASKMLGILKNAKVTLTHLGHTRKVVGFGPAADSPESMFEFNGERITVGQYFEKTYGHKLSGGRLRYPSLPTINMAGPKRNPILVPAELLEVESGQTRNKKMDADMLREMIKAAAVRPAERQRFITDPDGVIGAVKSDQHAALAFGFSGISNEAMAVEAALLPQAKLLYKDNMTVDPGFSGTWKMDRQRFFRSPSGSLQWSVVVVGKPRGDWRGDLKKFASDLERDSNKLGVQLPKPENTECINESARDLEDYFRDKKKRGVIFVLVAMSGDCYGLVKSCADMVPIITQCIKYKNIEKTPRGMFENVMLKVNAKLGGINHTLISRQPAASAPTFQLTPSSLSWLLDEPCMLMGVDLSHPEAALRGGPADGPSVAAAVGSMDGSATQFAAHVTLQASGNDDVMVSLYESTLSLLRTFYTRNKTLPKRVVVYRDGVGEGAFQQVVDDEVPKLKRAFEDASAEVGSMDEIKFSLVLCQKRHHALFVFKENGDGKSPVNLCPGVVMDAAAGPNSVSSATHIEFYLNSHVAIQGTGRPCKYSLLYDEIGFKLSELELLTYWTTYLYCRCNKSVSYATPAYYAHWAAKRGRHLLAAGLNNKDLQDISKLNSDRMFFV